MAKKKEGKKKPAALKPGEVAELAMGNGAAIPKLRVACGFRNLLPLEALADFQGEFKTLTDTNRDKLRKEITELGFVEPISIWDHAGKHFILNGHQRVVTLRWMESSGLIDCAAGVPVNTVLVDSESDARKVCLALASTYGRTNKKGLAAFLKKAKISEEEAQYSFSFPDLEIEELNEKAAKKKVEFEAADGDGEKGKCPACGIIRPMKEFKMKDEAEEGGDPSGE